MAHPEQHFFVAGVKQFLPGYFGGKRVLEIGSLNINGSVRQYFEGCEYVGLDVGPGRDVDVVCPGQHYGDKAESFDVVISCEAMEHNPDWRRTWLNMLRLVRDDGLVVMTCATPGRKQHGTSAWLPDDSPLTMGSTPDYYRNLAEADFRGLAPVETWFAASGFHVDHSNHDLYFFGIGRSASQDLVEAAGRLEAALADHYYRKNVLGVR